MLEKVLFFKGKLGVRGAKEPNLSLFGRKCNISVQSTESKTQVDLFFSSNPKLSPVRSQIYLHKKRPQTTWPHFEQSGGGLGSAAIMTLLLLPPWSDEFCPHQLLGRLNGLETHLFNYISVCWLTSIMGATVLNWLSFFNPSTFNSDCAQSELNVVFFVGFSFLKRDELNSNQPQAISYSFCLENLWQQRH